MLLILISYYIALPCALSSFSFYLDVHINAVQMRRKEANLVLLCTAEGDVVRVLTLSVLKTIYSEVLHSECADSTLVCKINSFCFLNSICLSGNSYQLFQVLIRETSL